MYRKCLSTINIKALLRWSLQVKTLKNKLKNEPESDGWVPSSKFHRTAVERENIFAATANGRSKFQLQSGAMTIWRRITLRARRIEGARRHAGVRTN